VLQPLKQLNQQNVFGDLFLSRTREKKVNKSFRSVWSEALGVWVAVSEVCTARGKKSSSITIGAGLLATAAFGK
jgi:hypothetical protein